MSHRVGIDLVRVADVEESVRSHGERYLGRIFTDDEQADCGRRPERLAARFAAKEATIKVLRPLDDAVPWRDIEVRRHEGGWVELQLHRAALALARQAGIDDLALSLTHEGDYASAVVLAQLHDPPLDK